MKDRIVNLDNEREKNMLLQHVRSLRGMHRVSVKQYRPKRSDRQNRFYHPCIVAPFAEWAREQGNEITDEEAHEFLKAKFLTVEVVDKNGEIIGTTVRSTTSLDVKEFAEYVDKCIRFLNEFCEIQVVEPY